MADNYCQCTPTQALKATKKEAYELIKLLEKETEDAYHGFRGDYYKKDKEFYMYAEDSMDETQFSKAFLLALARLIKKNKMD